MSAVPAKRISVACPVVSVIPFVLTSIRVESGLSIAADIITEVEVTPELVTQFNAVAELLPPTIPTLGILMVSANLKTAQWVDVEPDAAPACTTPVQM